MTIQFINIDAPAGCKAYGGRYFKFDDANGRQCYRKEPRRKQSYKYLYHTGVFWVLSDTNETDVSISDTTAYCPDEHFPVGYTEWVWNVKGDWKPEIVKITFYERGDKTSVTHSGGQ